MNLKRRLIGIGLVFGTIILVGGMGYRLIEGWSWVDAIYMSIITVTTVGFGEVYPLSPVGRLFTTMLIVLGVAGITYAFSALTNYVIAGELGGILERRRMARRVNLIREHYIVCGFGRVGHQVCIELKREGQPLVVVDDNPPSVERAESQGYPVVVGDAGDDQILQEAGIDRAVGLVAAVDSDATNLMVVLSARALNPDLYIVARASLQDTEAKMVRAGADRVISPYSLGGRRLALMLIRPDVVDFLDVVMHDETLELLLEDLTVGEGCTLDQCSVGDARIRKVTGANILGLKRKEGGIVISPEASTVIQHGDVLIALGTRGQLETLASLVSAPPGPPYDISKKRATA
jgi:voltage-gated potassium channel